MNVYERTVISFDPVKEYKYIESFIENNADVDWKEENSTVATSFIIENRYHADLLEVEDDLPF